MIFESKSAGSRMMRGAPLIILLPALLLSCARRAPMISTAAPIEGASDVVSTSDAPSTRLVEARPNGLLITMQPPADTPVAWTRAALLRQHQDEPVTLLHSVAPDETQRAALYEKGMTLLDRDLEPTHRYSYVTALYDAEDQLVWRGRAASLEWLATPEAPESVEVEAMAELGVRISWSPRGQGWGVLVLRRTLGAKDTSMQRLAYIPSDRVDTYVDREVSPGVGYVYRLAHARKQRQQGTRDEYMVLGLPGPEIYAVLAEASKAR